MTEITLGQFYPADSILHKLDPRVKFIGTFVYIVSLFLVKGLVGYIYAIAVLLTFMALSKVPGKIILKSLKPVWFILIITVGFNLFLTQGEVIWQLGFLKVTEAGIRSAIKMGIRLLFLVMGCSLMTLTTTPNQLTDGMERLFGPLKKIHVPVHEVAMMMSIALRFIPILMEETDKIRKAQIARGADFENGNFMKRVKAMIPLLVPLFVSAFRRANDLALAMEARCYHGGDDRTQMKPLVYARRDYIAFVVLLLILAGAILMRIFGDSIL
ncbi:MAG: energy-coupling factor transporter transmembrane component T [Lachnospiraceae bacterium]|nr:energy-coupling factor transporter transmembrane component T [Lachnospiraceae bacterium]